MKNIRSISLLIVISFLFTNCGNRNDAETIAKFKKDSTELTILVRNIFKWHQSDSGKVDFPYQISKSLYTGIDWKSHKKRLKILEKTNYFSKDFLKNYQAIALKMDNALKKSDPSWRSIDDVPSFEPENDHWCECQEYPDIYWNIISLSNFEFNKDSVRFNWSWQVDSNNLKLINKAHAVYKNGKWQISYFEGFDIKHFGIY